MKVISPIFSSMRGKLGGAVGAVSRGGVAYFRALVIPSNPRSVQQTTMRLITTALAAAWRGTLSDLQRAGWTAISPDTSSGIDTYLAFNSQALLANDNRIDDAPDSRALITGPYEPANITVDASAHTVALAANSPGVDCAVNVFLSAPQQTSRLAQQFPFRFIGVSTDVEAGGTVNIPITHPAYNLVAGDIVYVRLVQFGLAGGTQEGKLASEQTFRATVVA